MSKFPCFAGHLQHLPTPRNTLEVSYKEGVAGSNPASPTWKKRHLQVNRRTSEWAGIRFLALLLQPYCNLNGTGFRHGSQRRFHRVDCGVLHVPRSKGRATHKRATFPLGPPRRLARWPSTAQASLRSLH
jgi:hypothetical protein